MLEALAELVSVPAGELVTPDGSEFRQVSPDEAALLRALRKWPLSVTRSLCGFVAFFADEPPVIQQTRNLHEVYRRLEDRQREAVYAFAVMQREGAIPREIEQRLFEQLSVESKAAVGRKNV